MSDLIWLSEVQMRRIEPYFPLSHSASDGGEPAQKGAVPQRIGRTKGRPTPLRLVIHRMNVPS